MKTWWKVPALALAVVFSRAAFAGDFVDTRLTFTFADDNVLAGAGETTPNSPNPGFFAGQQNTLFFDNFNTKFSGFESLSNLTLYKKSPSFFEGFTAEAALSVLFLLTPAGGLTVRDNSSYVTLNWTPPGWGDREGLSLTGFPVSGDRFRLGYAYKISWGGNDMFTSRAQNDAIPGLKLQLTRERFYVFGGVKTGLLLNDYILEKERIYGGLVGGGVDITSWLRLDVGGGYFQKGIVPGLANQGIVAPVNSGGGSMQLIFYKGIPPGTSIDLRLYKNDPDYAVKFFAPESYPGGFAFQASLEGTYLTQTLENPDVFARTQFQSAQALALQARIKWNYLRVNFLGLYRTLSYIQFNVPGLPPYKDFPTGTTLTPETFAAVGADYHFPRAHLTTGVIGGVQLPATFRAPSAVLGGNNPTPGLTGSRTLVVRDVNQFSILPTNYSSEPIISVKSVTRLDISDYFAAILEVYYTFDNNRTTFRDSVSGIAEPSFEKPNAIGFNAVLQARY